MSWGITRYVSHKDLYVGEVSLRAMLMGRLPTQAEVRVVKQRVFCTVHVIEKALAPHGGLKTLRVRPGPEHLGGVTEFAGRT